MLFGKEHVDRYLATDGKEGHDWQGTQTLDPHDDRAQLGREAADAADLRRAG